MVPLRRSAIKSAAGEVGLSQSGREPEDVRGAISVGLSLYEEGKYQEALSIFERALKLPGTGQKRYR